MPKKARRQIAEAIGRGLKNLAVSLWLQQAAGHFGRAACFAGMDATASNALIRQRLGWQPA